MTDSDNIAEFDEDAMEHGRWLFAQDCIFMIGAAALRQVPDSTLPEIAFAGRSNVGKSSLINTLTGRSTLARTSNTPGRTQQINFFNLGGRMIIADLPGYGFARAPKPDVDRWQRLVDAYLKGRSPLRRVCLLIDSRHGVKDVDRKVMKMLDVAAVSYQIVLTKADKIGAGDMETLSANVKKEMRGHTAAHPAIAITSSAKGTGIAELRAALGALAQNGKNG